MSSYAIHWMIIRQTLSKHHFSSSLTFDLQSSALQGQSWNACVFSNPTLCVVTVRCIVPPTPVCWWLRSVVTRSDVTLQSNPVGILCSCLYFSFLFVFFTLTSTGRPLFPTWVGVGVQYLVGPACNNGGRRLSPCCCRMQFSPLCEEASSVHQGLFPGSIDLFIFNNGPRRNGCC